MPHLERAVLALQVHSAADCPANGLPQIFLVRCFPRADHGVPSELDDVSSPRKDVGYNHVEHLIDSHRQQVDPVLPEPLCKHETQGYSSYIQ